MPRPQLTARIGTPGLNLIANRAFAKAWFTPKRLFVAAFLAKWSDKYCGSTGRSDMESERVEARKK